VSLRRHGDDRGTPWLVSSQLSLLVGVLAYVAFRLNHIDVEPMRRILTEQQRETIALAGFTDDQFLRTVYTLSSSLFGVVTFFYQGGMAFYYHRRRAAITAALKADSDS
jgi:hypothetical protein